MGVYAGMSDLETKRAGLLDLARIEFILPGKTKI